MIVPTSSSASPSNPWSGNRILINKGVNYGNPFGTEWQLMPQQKNPKGRAPINYLQVSVSEQGVIWYSVIDYKLKNGESTGIERSKIYQWNGIEETERTLVDASGVIKQFDLGNSEAWAVNVWNEVFKRTGVPVGKDAWQSKK
jgi:hypothetical protein